MKKGLSKERLGRKPNLLPLLKMTFGEHSAPPRIEMIFLIKIKNRVTLTSC